MQPHRVSGSLLTRLSAFAVVSIIAGALVALMALPVVGFAGIAVRDTISGFEQLPDNLETPPLPEQSVILAADGSPLATVYRENRIEVPLSQVSPWMRQAIVAIEDSRFLEHNGIDLRGTFRALAANTSGGGVQQGGSTLTMQYVKNVLINNATSAEEIQAARERTPVRKLREMRYALALERRFTKDQILERYLNIAYFGAGAYGVEAAARRYFSKPASDLTLVESATLAGIVQQPTAFDPTRNPDLSTLRRNAVLRRMVELGYLTDAQGAAAIATPMRSYLNPSVVTNGCTSSWAPFFCDFVMRTVAQDPAFGATAAEREAFLRRGGLTIKTTLDPKIQNAAYTAVINQIPIDDPSRRATAIAMVQPGTGRILAMAQNRRWGTSGRGNTTYNYAVDQKWGGTLGMQAGSSFKPFTIAAALDLGISPFERIDSPYSKTWDNFTNCTTGEKFPPATIRSSTGAGTFDMLEATAYSVNTYFIELEARTNLCRQADIAEQLGVRLSTGEPLNRVPTFAIGSNEVTPLAMAGAYAAFANHGLYCPPTPIIEIRDRSGQVVDFPRPQCTRVLSRDVADTLTAILTRVIDGPVDRRTGQNMTLDRPAAGKTGTTNDSAAVWFCGYTPDLAGAVWVGDPRGGYRYPMKDVTINGTYYTQVFGSSMPGPIWKAAMLAALDGSPPIGFDLVNQWGLGPARDAFGNYSDDGSAGPPIAVPRTIGLSEKDATDLLEYAGFKVKVEYREVVGQVGVVVDQDPAANRMLSRNTKITIIVSKGVAPSPDPTDTPSGDPTTDPSVTPSDSASPDPTDTPSGDPTTDPSVTPSDSADPSATGAPTPPG